MNDKKAWEIVCSVLDAAVQKGGLIANLESAAVLHQARTIIDKIINNGNDQIKLEN